MPTKICTIKGQNGSVCTAAAFAAALDLHTAVNSRTAEDIANALEQNRLAVEYKFSNKVDKKEGMTPSEAINLVLDNDAALVGRIGRGEVSDVVREKESTDLNDLENELREFHRNFMNNIDPEQLKLVSRIEQDRRGLEALSSYFGPNSQEVGLIQGRVEKCSTKEYLITAELGFYTETYLPFFLKNLPSSSETEGFSISDLGAPLPSLLARLKAAHGENEQSKTLQEVINNTLLNAVNPSAALLFEQGGHTTTLIRVPNDNCFVYFNSASGEVWKYTEAEVRNFAANGPLSNGSNLLSITDIKSIEITSEKLREKLRSHSLSQNMIEASSSSTSPHATPSSASAISSIDVSTLFRTFFLTIYSILFKYSGRHITIG